MQSNDNSLFPAERPPLKNEASEPVDVLAVIRAPLEQYPPSLNQVEILAEAGLRVVVIDTWHPQIKTTAFDANTPVLRIRPARHVLRYKEKLPSTVKKIIRAIKFRRCVCQTIQSLSPKVVIAYDIFGFYMISRVLRSQSRPRIVAHFHELPEYEHGQGHGTRLAYRFTLRYSSWADHIIFPDKNRAERFVSLAELPKSPTIVMNCPRVLEQLPKETLHNRLAGLGYVDERVVYYHGWIGSEHGLETTIQSMPYWPAESVLVLVGPVSEIYKRILLSLAHEFNVDDRVIFLGAHQLEDLPNLAVGADLGCAIFPTDSDNINFRYLAGASNKRFQYMSVGLAQVTNTGPGMMAIVEKYGCGVLVDPTSPKDVGHGIHSLLMNASRRKQMSKNARKAHLEEYNYDNQFSRVREQIVQWTTA